MNTILTFFDRFGTALWAIVAVAVMPLAAAALVVTAA